MWASIAARDHALRVGREPKRAVGKREDRPAVAGAVEVQVIVANHERDRRAPRAGTDAFEAEVAHQPIAARESRDAQFDLALRFHSRPPRDQSSKPAKRANPGTGSRSVTSRPSGASGSA